MNHMTEDRRQAIRDEARALLEAVGGTHGYWRSRGVFVADSDEAYIVRLRDVLRRILESEGTR